MQYSVTFHTSLTREEMKEIGKLWRSDSYFFGYFFKNWTPESYTHEDSQDCVIICNAYPGGLFTSNIDNPCKAIICEKFNNLYHSKNGDKEYNCTHCGFGTGVFVGTCPICKNSNDWMTKDGHVYDPKKEYWNLRRHYFDD